MVDEVFYFPCTLADSPLQLWHHLAVKLVLNTLSTATMVRMDRVIGNAMVLRRNAMAMDAASDMPSDLRKRSSSSQPRVHGMTWERDGSSEQACIVLHKALEEVESLQQQGKEVPSPVALAIERIQSG